MKKIGAHLLFLFLKLASYLPYSVIYFLSNVTYFLLYHVFAYRRWVVKKNIALSFPHKTDSEIETIEKQFYRHLSDVIWESIKGFSSKPEKLAQKIELLNPKILDQAYAKNKNVIVALGHFGNWELAASKMAQTSQHTKMAMYLPSANKHFDKLLKQQREKSGIQLVSSLEFRKVLKEKKEQPFLLAMVGDQTPFNLKNAYWNKFLRRATPWHRGIDTLARRYNCMVFYAEIVKKERGQYQAQLTLISEHPNHEKDFFIIEEFTRLLKKSIFDHPHLWLWSHRRWKRSHLKPEQLTLPTIEPEYE